MRLRKALKGTGNCQRRKRLGTGTPQPLRSQRYSDNKSEPVSLENKFSVKRRA